MNNLLAVLIVLGAQLGAHSTVGPAGVTHSALAFAAAGPASAQDAGRSASQPPVIEAEPRPSLAPDPAADLLMKAAHFQRGDTPQDPPTGLHGVFVVHVRDLSNDSAIDAKVERLYLRDPERMLTTRTDHLVESNSTVGFDGTRAWFRDNATGKVIVYTDDPLTFDVDLEQLRSQLQLMPVLLDAFVLDALMPRLEGLTLEGEELDMSVGSRGTQTARVQWVVGRIEDELFDPEPGPPPLPGLAAAPAPELQVGLAIEPETGKLWAFRVRTLGRSEARQLELKFFFHRPSESGLIVPAFTAVYQDGASDAFITLSMTEDPVDGELILDLDPQADDGTFAVPD